ncbi:MFS transporter [Vulcanisaeta thermophila]|uniref:MFS transporter n=1 Tax=Vulcanisaeta thermophila TaxID=867917 RepID=UPI0009FC5206|nr:MFS transporter [Vulcanisaeta thermophila]
MSSVFRYVEDLKWSRVHTWSFVAFAFGLLFEAYLVGIAPIATGWFSLPTYLETLVLIWPFLWLIVGLMIAGPISDRVGRKRTFIITMSMYAVGIALFILSTFLIPNYLTLLITLAIMLAAAGAEMNVILTDMHEVMPRRHRSKAAFFLINFINLGLMTVSLISLNTQLIGIFYQRLAIGIIGIVILVVLVISRAKMPESIRWLERKGMIDRAINEVRRYYGVDVNPNDKPRGTAPITTQSQAQPPLWFRFVVAVVMMTANDVGFGLTAYELGPIYYPNATALIILLTSVAEFVAGLVIAPFADRLSRKLVLLFSTGGSAVVTYIVVALMKPIVSSFAIFMAMDFILNFFIGIQYLAMDTFKGELWPTERRGTFVSLVRLISIGSLIPTTIWSVTAPLSQYLVLNSGVWTAGLIAAIAWYLRGIETGKGTSIVIASGET